MDNIFTEEFFYDKIMPVVEIAVMAILIWHKNILSFVSSF